MIGPCAVARTCSGTSSSPRTRMVSSPVVSGRGRPSCSHSSPSTRSRYRSVTSGPRLVNPQAMSALWPMITPGTPENVKPATSSGHSLLTVVQCSPICIQIPGMLTPRCGSLASNGSPVSECSPSTTQLLLPTPSPRPTNDGSRSSVRCSPASWARWSAVNAGRSGLRVPPSSASGSKTPSTTAPPPTIGAWAW